MKNSQSRIDNPLLLLLLVAGDLFFIAMFGLLGLNLIDDPGFALIHDQTYAETYQYVKLFWLVLCFAFLAVVTRERLYGMLVAVFCFLLVDDYSQLHERWGEALAATLQFRDAFMLSSFDFGELLVFAVYGLVFVPAFVLSYRFSSEQTRKHATHLFEFVLVFAFFAVVVDVLHALHLPFVIRHSIGAVEDGGEMITISGMFWYVYCIANRSLASQGGDSIEADSETKIDETAAAETPEDLVTR